MDLLTILLPLIMNSNLGFPNDIHCSVYGNITMVIVIYNRSYACQCDVWHTHGESYGQERR